MRNIVIALLGPLVGGLQKSKEERGRVDQRGLQFWVELAGHKVGVVREFHNLHNVFVGGFSGENELLLVCARRVTLFNLKRRTADSLRSGGGSVRGWR